MKMTMRFKAFAGAMFLSLGLPVQASAGQAEPGEEMITKVYSLGVAPAKVAPFSGDEAAGPYKRLIIKNANIIDGTGAPAQGPVTIVIEEDRIVRLDGYGAGSFHRIEEQQDDNTRIIDAAGQYVLPGFIDAHAHLGAPTHAFVKSGMYTDPEYVNKLWLAHGITTVREAGSGGGLGWTLKHKQLSDEGKITAPRMKVYVFFPDTMTSASEAIKWVKAVHKRGADGIKFSGASPEAIEAAISQARKLNMKTMYHHAQISVTQINVLDSARMGLDSMEHWYGLPEAMFTDKRVQNYPSDYNYNDEQDRFSHAGRLWGQSARPGSDVWQATIKELTDLDFTIDPTFGIYEANRDTMRARNVEWFDDYGMPYVMRSFEPNPKVHGAFHFDWTTADEIAWKENYQLWMKFINDYKNAGGRVTAGSDSGFIYGLYGFGYIRELELLQEAGFHPLEVVQAATLNGAQLLGVDNETGSIQIGKKADLIVVNENPLANFKVLYGTGHQKLNHEAGMMERTKGIIYTIKDGIVFDAKAMLDDVKEMVANQKALEAQNISE
jgi:imidazolonepropionase-like amidohydrolase